MTTRTAPRYDALFSGGKFNGTMLIGPDPLGANFDYRVFLEARRRLRMIGLGLILSKRGYEEYQRTFLYKENIVEARIRLVMGRNYGGDLQEFWRETLVNETFIYLKTHAGYGRHLSLSDNVNYFTEFMKKRFDPGPRKNYQLYYLDCCKSEKYYGHVFRNHLGDRIDLILNQWFCDYNQIGPAIVLVDELIRGSDFDMIVSRMNDEYGIPHFDVEDDPSDMRLDRKMITYSLGEK